MRSLLLALVLVAGPKAAPKAANPGYKLDTSAGWTKSDKLTEASKERLSPNVDGGAIAWQREDSGAIARVLWFTSKHPSGVGVREELEALHEVFKSEAETPSEWKVTEDKVLMTSSLQYRIGDPLDGKGKSVHQVSITGVDREGRIRAWTLECGYPSTARAKGADKHCAALAASFVVSVPASEFRAIDPRK